MTATSTDTIERTIHIAAPPETVFQFLTDPDKMVEWMGRRIELDPRPGGRIRVDMNGFDIMSGEVLEVEPNRRIVHTMGWESLDLGDFPGPGQSRVEYTLTPDGDGTRLDFLHTGLSALAIPAHTEGWDMFLGRLQALMAGEPVESMAGDLPETDEIASQLNTLLVQAVTIVERLDDAAWVTPVPNDGRTAGVLAYHVAGHLGMIDLAKGIAAGGPDPGLTMEDIDAMNAEQAREQAGVTREQVLAALREAGPTTVSAVRELDPASLDRSLPMTFAGGNAVSVRDVLQGMLLASTAGHVEELRALATRV